MFPSYSQEYLLIFTLKVNKNQVNRKPNSNKNLSCSKSKSDQCQNIYNISWPNFRRELLCKFNNLESYLYISIKEKYEAKEELK